MEKVHLRTRLCPPLTSLGSGAGAWSRVWSPWLQAPHGAHVSVTEPMTSRTEKCWVKAGGQSDCRSDKQHRCPEAQTCESGPRRRPAPLTPAPRQSRRRRQLSEAARPRALLPRLTSRSLRCRRSHSHSAAGAGRDSVGRKGPAQGCPWSAASGAPPGKRGSVSFDWLM